MAKQKLALGAILVLVLSFGFSTFFALTALTSSYTESLTLFYFEAGLDNSLIAPAIDKFVEQQLLLALLILFACSIVLFSVITQRAPTNSGRWNLRNVGWPMVLVTALAQLLALGLYFSNFLNQTPVNQALADGLLDLVIEISVTLVIAVLLFAELLILLLRILRHDTVSTQSTPVPANSIRPAIFLFLFGVDLSSAFIPLHMENLYEPFLGLHKDVVMGLPISAMFLCVSITIMVSGIWLDRRGWHEPFLVGIVLTAFAKLYAWLAPNALNFIIAMGMVGLGYGLALMASQGFVVTHTDDRSKARGLAYLFAGLYAGSICGTATGAMLAERIGYNLVFLLGAIVVSLALPYVLLSMRGAFVHSRQAADLTIDEMGEAKSSVTTKSYFDFLLNRHVLGLVFLSSLPSAIAVAGFLNYFGPVYLDRFGASESTIGAMLIIYSLCMVYLAPYVSKYIDASDDKRTFVIVGCVLGACAFLNFQFFTGLVATTIAVLLLGLSSCFLLSAQATYALSLDVTKNLGEGRSLGIFRASSRIGQMLGPMLFSWLIVATKLDGGIAYFGVAYLLTATLFAFVTWDRHGNKDKLLYETKSAD